MGIPGFGTKEEGSHQQECNIQDKGRASQLGRRRASRMQDSLASACMSPADKTLNMEMANQLINEKKKREDNIFTTKGKTKQPPFWSCTSSFCEAGGPGFLGLSKG